jgi:hypothetical protein
MIQQHGNQALAAIDAEILAAAQAAAAHQSVPLQLVQPEPEERQPWAGSRALVVSWVLCLGLSLFNLEGGALTLEPRREIDPEGLLRGLRISAELDAVAIEDYRSQHGALPVTLDLVGLPADDPDLIYELLDDGGFRLTVRRGKAEGVFDSAVEASRRAAEEARLAVEAERRAAEAERWAAESAAWIADAETRAAEAHHMESFR